MYKIKSIIKDCKDIDGLRDFIRKKEIKLILFAETHGYLDEVPVQEKIVKLTKPNFFLYEMLEESKILNSKDAQKFLKHDNEESFSFISKYGELKPNVKLARKYKLPLIGCDIKNMCVRSGDWITKKFSQKEAQHIRETRETKQSKVINEYTKRGLVFASLGAYHLRRTSITTKNLKEKRFVVIYPIINGKPAFVTKSDPKNPRVRYEIKLVEKRLN